MWNIALDVSCALTCCGYSWVTVTESRRLGPFVWSKGFVLNVEDRWVKWACEGSSQSSMYGFDLSRCIRWRKRSLVLSLCFYTCVITLSVFVSCQRLTLLHVNSNQCLDMPTEEDKMVPTLRDCNGSRSQQWLLRNMTLSVWPLLGRSTCLWSSPGSQQVALTSHLFHSGRGLFSVKVEPALHLPFCQHDRL